MAKGGGKFWGGVLIGAGIGTIVGLLWAPRSGKETRSRIRKSLKRLPTAAEQAWEETLGRIQEAILAGQEASQRLYQEIEPPPTVETTARSEEK